MAEDLYYLDIIGERRILDNLDRMPDVVRQILIEKVRSWVEALRDKVESNILEKFKESTGRLLDSIDVEIIDDGVRVDGRVFSSGVPYAKAQEEGSVIPPHLILPTTGKVLAFAAATGEKVFATRVSHPGGQIVGKHYMKDAYREMGPEISRGIKNSVVQGIRANMRAGR